jgi:hypothetical protein
MPEQNNLVSIVRKYLKENKIAAVHLKGCECLTCTYDYPHKEQMIELEHFTAPMATRQLKFKQESELLALILMELRAMRQQEKDYWETCKLAKNKEATHSKEN